MAAAISLENLKHNSKDDQSYSTMYYFQL